MTTRADDDPEPMIVRQAIAEAQQTVQHLATLLQRAGWHAVILSLSRRVEVDPGDCYGPGATASLFDMTACGPILPQLVQVLRKQADEIEKIAQARGDEVTGGYIQDASDYASGRSEWPKDIA